MIDVKAAVKSALQYFQTLREMLGGQLEDLRLEEVELSEDKYSWLITLGYNVPTKPLERSEFDEFLASSTPRKITFRREYKLFRVNSETGEVEAMKIREV